MKNRVISGLAAFIIWTLLLAVSCSSPIAPEKQTSQTDPVVVPQITQQAPMTNPPQARPGTSSPMHSVPKAENSKPFPGTVVLGSPTDSSITVSLLTPVNAIIYIEYGKSSGNYSWHTNTSPLQKDQPLPIEINNLEKDTQYFYRVCHQTSGETDFSAGAESAFHTQRAPGSTFSFGVQGDSHPERLGRMFDPDLYMVTMNNVKNYRPDFYFTMGDDFSLQQLISKNQLTQQSVEKIYSNQRDFLGIVGSSSPLFLVNGNHEQAAGYLLNDTYPTSYSNAPMLAGKSRITYFSLPIPNDFYTGDTTEMSGVGLPRDYYTWEWGDALFVVIDPYWHSPVPISGNEVPGVKLPKDQWGITIGDAQYEWFKKNLEESKAKYKFVFEHHVLGGGRGGIELAGLYEWGGNNQKGAWEFDKMRPGWEMPIHQLMVENHVTIFFQGHDHLFCRQELDGVVYQSVPNPADPTYQAFNSDAYHSGIVLPNSGFLNVTVSADQVKVAYISSYLPKDENDSYKNGWVAYSYTIQ